MNRYTSFLAQNPNCASSVMSAFRSNTYEVLPDQETLNAAGNLSEPLRSDNGLSRAPALNVGKREKADELGSVDGDFYASVSTRGTASNFVSVVDMADTFEDWTNVDRALDTLSNNISSQLETNFSMADENEISAPPSRLKQALSLGSFSEDLYSCTVPKEDTTKDSTERSESGSCLSLVGKYTYEPVGGLLDDLCAVTEGTNSSACNYRSQSPLKMIPNSPEGDMLHDQEQEASKQGDPPTREIDKSISNSDVETQNEKECTSLTVDRDTLHELTTEAHTVAPGPSDLLYASIPEVGPSDVSQDANIGQIEEWLETHVTRYLFFGLNYLTKNLKLLTVIGLAFHHALDHPAVMCMQVYPMT